MSFVVRLRTIIIPSVASSALFLFSLLPNSAIADDGDLGPWSFTTNTSFFRWDSPGVAAHNGYLYAVGGHSTNEPDFVEYARINADGSLGPWTGTSSTNTPRAGLGVAAYNGYLYAVNGFGPGDEDLNTVEYARINADGTLGPWSFTTSMSFFRWDSPGVAAHNGYLYAVGGHSTNEPDFVEYARINADGSLGPWTGTTATNTPRAGLDVVAYNGYLYAVNGSGPGDEDLNTVEYARINADGTLGPWTGTSNTNTPRAGLGVAAFNGYLYAVGGHNVNEPDFVEFAQINADGSLGPWTNSSSTNTPREFLGVATYNGYLYAVNGSGPGSGPEQDLNTVEYAKINSHLNINAGLNDAWVSTDAALQGFFFTVFPQLKVLFLAMFTFDSVPPDQSVTAVFGAADQRWVTGLGGYAGDSVTVNVELTSGGIFNGSDPLATQQPDYGTITIVFINCKEALLTYNFPSAGLSGQMTLTRVVPDNVALCEALQ